MFNTVWHKQTKPHTLIKEYGGLFRRDWLEDQTTYKPRKEEQGLYLEDAAVAGYTTGKRSA